MKILTVLRKLGIVRFGFKAGTYKSGTDRPYEFMSDDIYNSEKETVTKEDLKAVFSKDKTPAPTEGPKFCPKCGTSLKQGAAFCSKCGNKISSQPSVKSSTAPSPAAPPPLPSAPRSSGFGKKLGCGAAVILALGLLITSGVFAVKVIGEQMAKMQEAEAERIKRTIENAVAYGSDKKIPSAPEGIEFKLYENSDFKFSAELPKTWSSKTVRSSLVCAGEAGTEQERTTINFQAVKRTDATSLKQQAEEFLAQLQSVDGYILEGSALEVFRDTEAAFLLVSYDNHGTKARQLQLIIQHDDIYIHAGYTAPADIFDKYIYAMDHCIFTFKFARPAASSVKNAKDTTEEKAGEIGKDLDNALQSLLNSITGNPGTN